MTKQNRIQWLTCPKWCFHVYAHIGYGNRWDNLYDYQMNRTDKGFEVNIPVLKSDNLSVCFKDCANNWDNNSGNNYIFDTTK